MKTIKQYPSQLELRSLFTYDDGKLIWKINAAKNVKAGTIAGSLNKDGYYHIGINGKRYQLHRLIYIYHNGAIPSGYVVDHVSGIKADNRIENLQTISQQQNTHKSKLIHSTNSSGYRGVNLNKARNKWQTQIKINNKTLYLGYFDDIIEAAMAYDRAAIKYHGDFARTNFPIDNYTMAVAAE